jgi:CheY-like chemotaxis protein
MHTDHKILCVDDDSDDLELLHQALMSVSDKYTILEAHDGTEAMNTLQEMMSHDEIPCLIVLDINMPRMNGRDAFIAIRKEEALKDVPIVIFSTSSSPLDKTFFTHKNAEYFIKPINYVELAKVAAKMLRYCKHQ